MSEAIYPDGSYSQPGLRAGGMAVRSLSLFAACQALEVYLRHDGRMQLTANGHRKAVINVIEPMTGEKFTTPSGKVTKAGCRKALAAGRKLLDEIDASRVVLDN